MIDRLSVLESASSIAGNLLRWRFGVALLGIVIFACTFPASQQLDFRRSISAMFEPTDKTFLAYQHLQDSFGGNAVVMLVYRDPALASVEGLQRNQTIANRVQQIEGVGGVLSLSVLNRAVEKIQPGQLLTSEPVLFLEGNRVGRGFDTLFSGYTHSTDHSRASIVAMLDPNHPASTIEQLEKLASDLSSDHSDVPQVRGAKLVGEPVLVNRAFEAIERDGVRLATLTIALLSIVLVVSLADARFVLLSAVMIGWSVTFTKATMVWFGIHLSLVSTILTAIVTVISVTTVLHLGVRFRLARARGVSQEKSAARAISFLLVPIALTCATDAAGFAALNASRILPIRQFGLMIAISALAVCLATLLFTPLVMMLPGLRISKTPERVQRQFSRWLRRRCVRAANFAISKPALCFVTAVVATIVGVWGMSRAKTETSFLNNFRGSSRVVQAYADVEANLGGAGVWDVVLDAPAVLTADYLDQVRSMESDLREIDAGGAGLTKVLSLADAEAIASQAPLSKWLSPASRLSAMYLVMPVFFDALLNNSPSGDRQLRIMLRSREQLESKQKTALIEEVEAVVRRHVSSPAWRKSLGEPTANAPSSVTVTGEAVAAEVTGYYVLMARLVNQLIGDQWRCFLASGVMVWILLVCATRSVRLATAALLPNLLPIFVVLGLVGWFGGKINMGVAMIAAVSIGLAIDGSVHFLSSYRRCRDRGHDARDSATHAAGNIGVPVLLATLALVVGFGVMTSSEFIPTATFGVLVAAALALGTAVNLTLLPALVAHIDGKSQP